MFDSFLFLGRKKNFQQQITRVADYSSLYSDLHLLSYIAHFYFFKIFLRAKATLAVQKVKVFLILAAGLNAL